MTKENPFDFDAIVIGSGFGGAVTACRLVQAGYRICILERGRRYERGDFPHHPSRRLGNDPLGSEAEGQAGLPDFSRWFWAQGEGLWDIRDLGDAISAQAAGYGGGSLLYANVHLRAPAEVFEGAPGTHSGAWPDVYRREKLDPYYDLAAFRLNVRPIPAEKRGMLQKTRQMDRVAERLGRRSELFYPPLAINFDPPERGGCTDCGYCWLGCDQHAKNTLDLNYLAEAESARDENNVPLADVRTLAEVVCIKPIVSADWQGGYSVGYRDLLLLGSETIKSGVDMVEVTAPYVFLCAGAVNTTELLFRNQGWLSPDRKGSGFRSALGNKYHPNSDSFWMVFDTEEPQEPDRGPTITTSLLYDADTDRGGRRDWFLVQDGGIPADLEPLLGVFRSPLWARRNRYREGRAPESSCDRPPGYAGLPFQMVQDLFRALKRNAERTKDFKGASPWSMWPWQAAAAYERDRDQLLDFLAHRAGPQIDRVVERAVDGLSESKRLKLEDLLGDGSVPGGIDLQGASEYGLPVRIFRLVTQLVAGSAAGMARQIAESLMEGILAEDSDRGAALLNEWLCWLLDYRVPNGHTAILLTMGRDSRPGCLEFSRDRFGHVGLSARLPEAGDSPERVTQERLLREMAKAWGGELRTNPVWPFYGARVVSHSQGGCPMSDKKTDGVTLDSGQVRGCPGLYVMDAAAFPTSVGVNPSATIAAVAEYKIERFIRGHAGKRSQWGSNASWEAPERSSGELGGWLKEYRRFLDPVSDIQSGETSSPELDPLGLEFSERMTGYHFPADSDFTDLTPATIWKLKNKELAGIEELTGIETNLTLSVEDVTGFLSFYAKDTWNGKDRCEEEGTSAKVETLEDPPRFRIRGSITFTQPIPLGDGGTGGVQTESLQVDDDPSRSYLQMFLKQRFTRKGREYYHYTFKYRLEFDDFPQVFLEGYKVLHDDPGFDFWEDTTTMFFGIFFVRGAEKGNEEARYEPYRLGVLRVPFDDFFSRQIRSVEITNTDDPARQSWALAAFGRFFFGKLAKIYLPQREKIERLARGLLTRTHGY